MSAVEDRESLPVPPATLAGYVIGLPGSDAAVEDYRLLGARLRELIDAVLGDAWSRPGARALDFGCGPGRVLRQYAPDLGDRSLTGCDIDADCVAWVNEHLGPGVTAHVTGTEPPLPFADASFDVAWSIAVLPHILEPWAEWLLELRRVLVPGAPLLVSLMGSGCSEAIAGEPWDPDRIGMTVRGPGRPWSAGGPMALHSEWWIRAHWGRAFDIVRYEAEGVLGQDLVLLRHPGGPAPTADALRAPEPDEPRELRAAQHALALAAQEHRDLNARHDAYAAAYAAEQATTAALRADVARLQAELEALRGAPDAGLLRRRRRS